MLSRIDADVWGEGGGWEGRVLGEEEGKELFLKYNGIPVLDLCLDLAFY